jgi:hypothetical protein
MYTEQYMRNANKRLTLGLAMIMKDEVADLDRILTNYGQYFDKIYLTVTDKSTYEQIKGRFAGGTPEAKLVSLTYFKWQEHFGAARRFNQKHVTTDYWMWIDLDDEIEGAEHLAQVVEDMAHRDLDGVMFKHNTYQNEYGQTEGLQWRERVIRTQSRFQWDNVRVHEGIIAPPDMVDPYANTARMDQVTIKHHTTIERMQEHVERNLTMVKLDWQETKSLRAATYLGKAYILREDYDNALPMFLYAIEHSNWDDQKATLWQLAADCYLMKAAYTEALE